MIKLQRVLRKRILLADDEEAVREAIRLLLNVDEHQVTEASNGREALELFRREGFDLVITDYAMPEMQGDELATRIKRLAPAQPIILITAFAERFCETPAPVEALLSKPFTFENLRRAIASSLAAASERSAPAERKRSNGSSGTPSN